MRICKPYKKNEKYGINAYKILHIFRYIVHINRKKLPVCEIRTVFAIYLSP